MLQLKLEIMRGGERESQLCELECLPQHIKFVNLQIFLVIFLCLSQHNESAPREQREMTQTEMPL